MPKTNQTQYNVLLELEIHVGYDTMDDNTFVGIVTRLIAEEKVDIML